MKVAVVGCGVMGAASAWALTRRGYEVTVFEQFETGHKRGSSHGSSRIYRYSYPEPQFVAMMSEALPLWHDLEREAGTKILHQTGGLDAGKDLGAHASALTANDIAFELIDGEIAARRWPALALSYEEVLFQAEGGVVHADKAWDAFTRVAVDRGTRLLEGRRVDDLTPNGVADYDVTVVTAGGWAKELLASAGIALAVTPTRETVAYFRTQQTFPTLVEWGDPAVYGLHDPVYGLKVGEHIAGLPTDPDEEGEVNLASVDRLKGWVAARFPGVDPDPVLVETCIYTNTADEHFVLERRGRVVVASACSGHGFKFAPLIGDRVADMVDA
ncbi:MAG TPA: FAD-dependent oxidoreductase [Actinomycetota bacterium]|nr:FAD-dependent oxidoreductase [Actinomycetota bacterium]